MVGLALLFSTESEKESECKYPFWLYSIRLLSLSNCMHACMRACLQARASLCGVRTKLLVFDQMDKIFFIIVES